MASLVSFGSFANAPVSKSLILLVGLCSVFSGIFNRQYLFNVPLWPHLLRDWQAWRLVTVHAAFANSSELLFAVLLLFNVGISVEKLFGSIKFASFLVVSAILSSAISLLALFIFAGTGYSALPAGPFGLLFSLMYQYYCIVPSTYRFEIFGGHFSNKSFEYFFAVQLLSCQPAASLIPAVSGILAGALIRSNICGLKNYRLPAPIIKLACHARPLLGSMRIHRRSNRTIPAQPRSQNAGVASIQNALRSRAAGPDRGGTNAQTLARPQGQTQGAGGVGSNALQEWRQAFGGTHQARPVQVDPEALVNVRAMFPSTSQQAAEEALRNSNNDVNRAVEQLLISQSET